MTASEIIRAGQIQSARPWPRYHLSSQTWRDMVRALGRQAELQLEGLWADEARVYALFTRPDPLLVSAPVEAGVYAALSPARPEAAPFERTIGDLWGHIAADATDPRPWLDHGVWPVLRPMLERPIPNAGTAEAPEPLPAPEKAASLLQGPVRPDFPALLSLAVRGERLVQLDPRLGYAHRGVLALMRGRTPAEAARLVARLAGEGTVAHSVAFARAAEAALGVEPPPRAIMLRGIAAALERVAIHLHDTARTLEAAGRDPAAALGQRETLLQACHLGFGHRLMMDVVAPGGAARDITPEGAATLIGAIDALALPSLAPLRRAVPSACGRLEAGREEAEHALRTVLTRLRTLPEGALLSALPAGSGEGLGRAEGPRSPFWHWLLIQEGRIAQAFARDPAWLLWPACSTASVGATIGGLPLNLAAYGVSAAGMDL